MPAERRILNRALSTRITIDNDENAAYAPDNEPTTNVLAHTNIDTPLHVTTERSVRVVEHVGDGEIRDADEHCRDTPLHTSPSSRSCQQPVARHVVLEDLSLIHISEPTRPY